MTYKFVQLVFGHVVLALILGGGDNHHGMAFVSGSPDEVKPTPQLKKCDLLSAQSPCSPIDLTTLDYKLILSTDNSVVLKHKSKIISIQNYTNHGVAYDVKRKAIFTTSQKQPSKIEKITLTEDYEVADRLSYDVNASGLSLLSPTSLAFDWTTQNLYIADKTLGQIIVCHESRTNNASILCKMLVTDTDATALALHPKLGYMHWVDTKSRAIMRSGMDGSSKPKSVHTFKEDEELPQNLVIHQNKSEIYMVVVSKTTKTGNIESLKIDLKNPQEVVSVGLLKEQPPFSFDVYDDSIFLSDSTYDINNETVKGLLVMMDSINQTILTSPCEKANCSHICTPTPAANDTVKFKCHCPAGMELELTMSAEDAKSCREVNRTDELEPGTSTGRSMPTGGTSAVPPDGLIVGNTTANSKETGGASETETIVITVLIFGIIAAAIIVAAVLHKKCGKSDYNVSGA